MNWFWTLLDRSLDNQRENRDLYKIAVSAVVGFFTVSVSVGGMAILFHYGWVKEFLTVSAVAVITLLIGAIVYIPVSEQREAKLKKAQAVRDKLAPMRDNPLDWVSSQTTATPTPTPTPEVFGDDDDSWLDCMVSELGYNRSSEHHETLEVSDVPLESPSS